MRLDRHQHKRESCTDKVKALLAFSDVPVLVGELLH